jgi:hypothetical protein
MSKAEGFINIIKNGLLDIYKEIKTYFIGLWKGVDLYD